MPEHRPASSSKDHAILIIEDDEDIASLLTLHLGDSGYDVSHAATGLSGLEEATRSTWSLIILDLMLPGLDGMEICRRVRAHSPEVPILILTARGEEIYKILGFEVGADDYLTKPFSIRELLARVAALLRCSALSAPAEAPFQRAPFACADHLLNPDWPAALIRLGRHPSAGQFP